MNVTPKQVIKFMDGIRGPLDLSVFGISASKGSTSEGLHGAGLLEVATNAVNLVTSVYSLWSTMPAADGAAAAVAIAEHKRKVFFRIMCATMGIIGGACMMIGASDDSHTGDNSRWAYSGAIISGVSLATAATYNTVSP
jgi:hypothetical protein